MFVFMPATIRQTERKLSPYVMHAPSRKCNVMSRDLADIVNKLGLFAASVGHTRDRVDEESTGRCSRPPICLECRNFHLQSLTRPLSLDTCNDISASDGTGRAEMTSHERRRTEYDPSLAVEQSLSPSQSQFNQFAYASNQPFSTAVAVASATPVVRPPTCAQHDYDTT